MPTPRKPPSLICSDQVLQTLQWIRKHGFRPVALRPREKAAIDGKYADLDYRPPSDEFWKNSDYGVGIVTGPKHSGPIDVDLDCEEAVYFARVFLPQTAAIFGRLSKRDSHYLYRVVAEEMEKRAFLDPKTGTTIIELRGDGGHQTVMPGSIHQDTGEVVEWGSVPFPDLSTVDPDVLIRAVKKIAIAVLIARHMWLDGQRNQVNLCLAGMFFRLEWTEEETTDLISAVMSYCGDDDKTRVISIRNTFSRAERGNKIAGTTKLREFLKDDKLVDCVMSWAGSSKVNVVQEYNDFYATCLYGGKFRVVLTNVLPSEPLTFMTRDDFLHWTSWDMITVDPDKPPVAKAKVWMSSPRHRSYRTVEFLPGLEDSPPGTLNLWTGWAVQPVEGKCCAWLKMLREIICGGDKVLTNWMLHWFANIVREPMEKSLTAPVIIGNQGVGKSLLFAYFGEILGSAYVVATNPEHIHGKHNKHLAGALLLHSEEALYSGDKRHRSIIKSLITDRFRISEPKNIDAVSVRNWLRLALSTNESNAAAAEAGDRRYTGFDMGSRMLPSKLRDEVLEEMKNGGPAALFHFLLTMEYDPNIPRTNIKNESLERLKASNYSPSESWWYDTLATGQLLYETLSWASKPSDETWPEVVSSSALYTAMVIRSRDQGVRAIPSSVSFMSDLKKMTGRTFAIVQKSYDNPFRVEATAPPIVRNLSNRQNSIINMPDLNTCRKAFEKYVGQKVKWPGDLPEADKAIWDKEREEKIRKQNEPRPDF